MQETFLSDKRPNIRGKTTLTQYNIRLIKESSSEELVLLTAVAMFIWGD